MVGDDGCCCHLTSDKQPAGVNTLGDEEDQFNKQSSNTGINNTIDSASPDISYFVSVGVLRSSK